MYLQLSVAIYEVSCLRSNLITSIFSEEIQGKKSIAIEAGITIIGALLQVTTRKKGGGAFSNRKRESSFLLSYFVGI